MKISAFLFLVLCLVFPLCFQVHAFDWLVEIVDEEGVYGASSVVDDSGVIHCSYTALTGTYNSRLKYARKIGTDWALEVVDNYTNTGYQYTSIDLDGDNNPCIAYRDFQNNYLKYAHYNGTNWIMSTLDTTQWSGMMPSIKVDLLNHVHIAYFNWLYTVPPNQHQLKYAYYNGVNWSNYTIDEWPHEDTYSGCSIAIDTNNNPRIAYSIGAPGDYNILKYATLNGSSWSIETLDPSCFFGTMHVSLVLDQSNNPRLVYQETNGNLIYVYYNGSSWVFETADNYCDFNNTSLKLDAEGLPHIAYADYVPAPNIIKYAYKDGSTWIISTAAGITDCTGCSLSLNSENKPDILYTCQAIPSHLVYAHEYTTSNINLLDFSGLQKDDNILLKWEIAAGSEQEISGFNLYRRNRPSSAILDERQYLWFKLNNSPINPSASAEFLDTKVRPNQIYQYRLDAIKIDGKTEILGVTECNTNNSLALQITNIYPQPCHQSVNCSIIANSLNGKLQFRIYDLNGRLIRNQEIQPDASGAMNQVFNIADLSDGVYILRVSQGNLQDNRRIVIAK